MTLISIKDLYGILNGTSLDIVNREREDKYEVFMKNPPYELVINGKCIVDSIRTYDYRRDNDGTNISIAIYNAPHKRSAETFYYPKQKSFKDAAGWSMEKTDLIKILFEWEVTKQ